MYQLSLLKSSLAKSDTSQARHITRSTTFGAKALTYAHFSTLHVQRGPSSGHSIALCAASFHCVGKREFTDIKGVAGGRGRKMRKIHLLSMDKKRNSIRESLYPYENKLRSSSQLSIFSVLQTVICYRKNDLMLFFEFWK